MKHFILLPHASRGLQQVLLTRMLFLAGIVIMIVFIVPMMLSGEVVFDLSAGLTLILLGIALAIAYALGLQRLKRSLSTYKLTVAEDSITREMSNMPTLSIPIKDIRQICRNGDGSYTIKGKSALNTIGIPAAIERREELELLLTGIRPLTDKTRNSLWLKYQYFIVILVVGFLFGSYMIENKYVSTVMGILFIGAMCYSWVVQQRSRNVSKRVKLISYLMILPVFSVIMRLIALWTA